MALRTNEPVYRDVFPETVPVGEVPDMRTKSPHGKFALHSIRKQAGGD